MLVSFSCPAHADITMFGDVAVTLLKMMGHSGTVPGAFLADDVSAALYRLENMIESEKLLSQATEASSEGNDEESSVSISHRALPLIELLKAAAKDKCNVMWDSGT